MKIFLFNYVNSTSVVSEEIRLLLGECRSSAATRNAVAGSFGDPSRRLTRPCLVAEGASKRQSRAAPNDVGSASLRVASASEGTPLP